MNKLQQTTNLKQKKVLSHQTRQAISILQLNSLDLHKEIENIILENPFLEKEVDVEPSYNLEHSVASGNADIEEILNYHQDSDNLREYLIKQLDTSSFSEKEKKVAFLSAEKWPATRAPSGCYMLPLGSNAHVRPAQGVVAPLCPLATTLGAQQPPAKRF